MSVYYNEHDPFATSWLKELINEGLIAEGDVDDRDIQDVKPNDLIGYTQCHFFAGIGVWSYALRQAGWPDDSSVWTGSCPCQPFSNAGKGKGFDDERHLWPAWYHLIEQCKPPVIFGEQVASKDGLSWIDLVQDDMEAENYAFAPVDLCAAGVGAPHIRQRLYFVAERMGVTNCAGSQQRQQRTQTMGHGDSLESGSSFHRLANNNNKGLERRKGMSECSAEFTTRSNSMVVRVSNSKCKQCNETGLQRRSETIQTNETGKTDESTGNHLFDGTNPTNGHWRDADWLYCRDEKWRAVEPGTFPLAHGASERVGRLRGYGNAIVAPLAQVFIESYMELNR